MQVQYLEDQVMLQSPHSSSQNDNSSTPRHAPPLCSIGLLVCSVSHSQQVILGFVFRFSKYNDNFQDLKMGNFKAVLVLLIGFSLHSVLAKYDGATCCELARSEGAFLNPLHKTSVSSSDTCRFKIRPLRGFRSIAY